MDAELVYKDVIEFAQKRKRWLLVLTGFGLTTYVAYKVYHLPYLAKKRARLVKALGAFESVACVISDSADLISVVSKELKDFIQSDSDQIPNSLNQISKITKSKEFSESVVGVTSALSAGVSRGCSQSEMKMEGNLLNSGVCDRVMDKVLSSAGSGFASVVVGSFSRNIVMAFLESDGKLERRSIYTSQGSKELETNGAEEGLVPEWISLACSDRGKEAISDCIRVFVSTAVAVYLDKTMDINIYDDFFTGLTKPEHETRVRGLLVSVCNNAIDTLVKTSHQAFTRSVGSVMNSGLTISSLDENEEDKHKQGETSVDEMKERRSSDQESNSGWASSISSALSEPSNRRFILNVTGQVTFETVRSFLELLLEKVSASMKGSFGVAHEAMVDGGLEAVRYFTLKSFLIATVCVSLCLIVFLGDAWKPTPAESCIA